MTEPVVFRDNAELSGLTAAHKPTCVYMMKRYPKHAGYVRYVYFSRKLVSRSREEPTIIWVNVCNVCVSLERN